MCCTLGAGATVVSVVVGAATVVVAVDGARNALTRALAVATPVRPSATRSGPGSGRGFFATGLGPDGPGPSIATLARIGRAVTVRAGSGRAFAGCPAWV